MEKQAPQKALCLGPDPPLRFSIKFIEIMGFLRFWAFNTAGKTVTKVGIYSQPPLESVQKVTFIEKYRFLMILIDHYSWLRKIIRDPISHIYHFN
jgi:hypothetical protein